MAEMKLVITGAAGRMGRALIRAVHANPATTVHGALERKGSKEIGMDAGDLAGVGQLGVAVSDDALAGFVDADGVLDFTSPAASVEFAGLAAQARIVHILGTTGLNDVDGDKISAAARHATIVRSGNMSLGVNLLAVLVEQAARALAAEDYDIEILEMHHRNKVDAPSGTALLLGEAAASGRGIELTKNSVRGRDGHTGARVTGAVGFATLRGGSVVGEHSVLFSGEGEQITLSHSAQDRSIFARGAVHAALWARNRKPGLYSMRDVLGLAGR
jgi:4-hydroxy-tetrahydrodipicolinate reductase